MFRTHPLLNLAWSPWQQFQMLPTQLHQYDRKPKEQDANRELGGRGEPLAVYRRSTSHALALLRFQRQCACLEAGNRCSDGTLRTSLHRDGHCGILAAGTETETSSTAHDSYTSPQPCTVRTIGTNCFM